MKIKEATFHECPSCRSRKRLTEEEYGCDECKKPIDYDLDVKQHRQYLQVTVFHHEGQSEHLEFCSWRCALKGLKKVKSDYFVSLPYLIYDDDQKGIRAKDFWAALKSLR